MNLRICLDRTQKNEVFHQGFFSKCDQMHSFNGKLHFLCSECYSRLTVLFQTCNFFGHLFITGFQKSWKIRALIIWSSLLIFLNHLHQMLLLFVKKENSSSISSSDTKLEILRCLFQVFILPLNMNGTLKLKIGVNWK